MPKRLPEPYDPDEYATPVPATRQPAEGMPEVSPYSRGVALALSVTLGVFGAHRFYTGKIGTGLLMLVTFGGMGFWYLYDLILVASGEFRDAEERVVYAWSRFDRPAVGRGKGGVTSGQVEDLQEQLDVMRQEMGELAERVDFAERMLAQQRERGKLPGS